MNRIAKRQLKVWEAIDEANRKFEDEKLTLYRVQRMFFDHWQDVKTYTNHSLAQKTYKYLKAEGITVRILVLGD